MDRSSSFIPKQTKVKTLISQKHICAAAFFSFISLVSHFSSGTLNLGLCVRSCLYGLLFLLVLCRTLLGMVGFGWSSLVELLLCLCGQWVSSTIRFGSIFASISLPFWWLFFFLFILLFPFLIFLLSDHVS